MSRPLPTPAEPWTAPKGQESAASPKARLATRIAKFIKREIDSGAAVWEKNQQRPARPGDFLILVRGRTGGLFDGILQALKRENIPVAGADRIQLQQDHHAGIPLGARQPNKTLVAIRQTAPDRCHAPAASTPHRALS